MDIVNADVPKNTVGRILINTFFCFCYRIDGKPAIVKRIIVVSNIIVDGYCWI